MSKNANNTRSKAIVHELRARVRAMKIGAKLGTIKELREQFSASQSTVYSSLRNLEACGVIRRIPGRGYFRSDTEYSDADALTVDFEEYENRLIYFALPLSQGNLHYNNILAGAEPAAQENHFDIAILNIPLNQPCDSCAERLARHRPIGIIFSPIVGENAYEVNSGYLDIFERLNIKYVVVDNPISKNGIIRGNFIGADGYTAMRNAVRTLTGLGHRKIASVRLWQDVFTSEHRFNGIIDELRCENIPTPAYYHLSLHEVPLRQQGRREVRELLALTEPPTAIICSHDMIALNAIEELNAMQLTVPEDISIFGFCNDYFSETTGISTVYQPLDVIGRRAIETLMTMYKTNPHIQRIEFLPCKLIPRSSIAPPSPRNGAEKRL